MPMPVTKGDPPAEREIADGERSQIDHRPVEGEAAYDEAKPPEIQAQAVIVSSPYSPSGTWLIPTFLLILPKASAGA